MKNEIKFIELLAKIGDAWKALFDVDGKDIKIGISGTLVSIWGMQRNKNPIESFLKELGSLKIQWMLAKGDVQDYTFISNDVKKDDEKTMTLKELNDYLNNEIKEIEDKSKSIGFKAD